MTLEVGKVWIPLGLLTVLLLGVSIFFQRSYVHLNEVSLQVSRVQKRQQLLAQTVRTVHEVESAQRGFLLGGGNQQLQTYHEARGRLEEFLPALVKGYRSGENVVAVQAVGVVSRELLEQTEHSLQLYHSAGRQAAVNYALDGAHLATVKELHVQLRALEAGGAKALENAWVRYRVDLRNTRVAMIAATGLNLLLLLLVAYLLWRTLRSREHETQKLQRQVEERTRELATLSSHLQQVSEREKQQLARELHDSLGGLLVATKMDLAWLRSRLPTEDENLLLRWRRIQSSLDQGVDFKRRVVEQLRPTLLDNMGLYAALRWQLQDSCARAGLRCTDSLPDIEARLTSEGSIALFRVAQESFTNILKHSRATRVELRVEVDAGTLILIVADNGHGLPADSKAVTSGQGLAGMRHRVRALGGSIQIGPREEGGTEVRVEVPLSAILGQEGVEGEGEENSRHDGRG